MFSGFRHAVENLAAVQLQHSPKPSLDAAADSEARTSLDSQSLRASLSSSTQLAEAALTNLRKSLVTARPVSPAQRSGSPVPRSASTSETNTKPAGGRTTLEDRLRAKFSIGDVSNSSTPATSIRSSPVPIPVTEHPLSPSSTPLPDSPAVTGISDPLSPTTAPLPESPMSMPTIVAPIPRVHDSLELPPAQVTPSPVPSNDQDIHSSDPLSLSGAPFGEEQDSNASKAKEDEPTSHTGHSQDGPHEYVNGAESQPEGAPAVQEEIVAEIVAVESEGLQGSGSVETFNPVESSSPDDAAPSSVIETNRLSVAEDAGTPEDPPASDIVNSTSAGEDRSSEEVTAPNDVDAPNGHAGPPSSTSSLLKHQPPTGTAASPSPDIEALQRRLQLVEQRFADVSTSFKQLQAEKLAADTVLRELSSIQSIQEVDALRDFLQNANFKNEMAQDEIKRLTGKLTRQEERIEELRDIHRLESKSQSDQIEKLRAQVSEAEALLKASDASNAQLQEDAAKRKAEIEQLRSEVERTKGTAKEEEEKRVKAITLLKTVRQKLVKAERERDDSHKEIRTLKEKEKEEREKEMAERSRLQSEIDKANTERETAVLGLKAQFDKEIASLKERYEKELSALRGQYELEAITTKSQYSKELDSRNARVSELENSVKVLSGEKDDIFDQLQMRQAELESSQSHLELLQTQCTELQYQLREANDRIALVNEEIAEARQEHAMKALSPGGPSAEEVSRILSAAEAKYESRINDLRKRLADIERERDEGEADWSRKLSEKSKEVEAMKSIFNKSAKSREEESESTSKLKQELQALKDQHQVQQKRISELQSHIEAMTEIEAAAKAQLAALSARAADLQQHLDDSKNRELQLRANNKTLREELRKVQSSAALLERQRNPGVGYWASRTDVSTTEPRSPRSSMSESRDSSSRPGSPATVKADEDINVEYLRNVILQFLEHPDMRPHLVRILSTILRFTPQETRRLVAKV